MDRGNCLCLSLHMHSFKCLRTSEICPILFRVLITVPFVYSIANVCSSEAVVLALRFYDYDLICLLYLLPSEQINHVPHPRFTKFEFGSHCLIRRSQRQNLFLTRPWHVAGSIYNWCMTWRVFSILRKTDTTYKPPGLRHDRHFVIC